MGYTGAVPGRVRRRAFSPFATAVLSTAFSINTTPTKEQRECLAAAIGTTERRVQVWFQNRRQRTGATVPVVPRGANTSSGAPDAAAAAPLAAPECTDSAHQSAPEHLLMTSTAAAAAPAVAMGHALNATPVPSAGAPPSPPRTEAPPLGHPAVAHPFAGALLRECRPDMLAPGEAQVEGIFPGANSMEVYTSAHPPYEIMWASPGWLRFCGYADEEVRGRGVTLRVLQGSETDEATLLALMSAVHRREEIKVSLVNYTRHGVPFKHDIDVQPLVNSAGVAVIYKVASSNIRPLLAHELPPAALPSAAEAAAAAAADDEDGDDEFEEEDELDVDGSDGGELAEGATKAAAAAAAATAPAPPLPIAAKTGAVRSASASSEEEAPGSEQEEEKVLSRVPSCLEIAAF